MPNDTLSEFLPFFKALADETRLKLVGLLAREPYSGEALAELLKVKPATISHHLAKLGAAGLVETAQDGHAKLYALKFSAVRALAERLLRREALPQMAEAVDPARYERKVLKNFLKPDGALKEIPAQQKKLQIVLRHLLAAFEPERDYPEPEVNAVLSRYHPDTASLRRALISYKLMKRANGFYRRIAP
jgi:biotin operon repressor